MKTSYLDYYKMILDKISFDRQLLRKEYNKALTVLDSQEKIQLKEWAVTNGLHQIVLMPEDQHRRGAVA